MLGLQRNTVALHAHDPAWEKEASATIQTLWTVWRGVATDIRHVGSTSIPWIMAKPIVDIAVAVHSLEEAEGRIPAMEAAGFLHRRHNVPENLLFIRGEAEGVRTHHIHVVLANGEQWRNYLAFRDFLTANPKRAMAYEQVKARLASLYPDSCNAYTEGKADFIQQTLVEARRWAGERHGGDALTPGEPQPGE